MNAIFGAEYVDSGEIVLKGRHLEGSINRHMKDSVALLPSNRRENSVISDLSFLENFAIAEQAITSSKPFIDRKKICKHILIVII